MCWLGLRVRGASGRSGRVNRTRAAGRCGRWGALRSGGGVVAGLGGMTAPLSGRCPPRGLVCGVGLVLTVLGAEPAPVAGGLPVLVLLVEFEGAAALRGLELASRGRVADDGPAGSPRSFPGPAVRCAAGGALARKFWSLGRVRSARRGVLSRAVRAAGGRARCCLAGGSDGGVPRPAGMAGGRPPVPLPPLEGGSGGASLRCWL